MSKIFKDLKVFNPDTLLQDLLDADEGTVFILGEKHIKHHEGDDTVELTFVQVGKATDSHFSERVTGEHPALRKLARTNPNLIERSE